MERISPRQLGALVFVVRMGMAVVRLPALKHVKQGPDAWLGVLLGTAAGTFLLWGSWRLMAGKPGRDILSLSGDALGPYLGWLAGACYVLFWIWDALVSLRMFSGLLIAQPLPETPAEAFLVLLAVGAAYLAAQGPEVIGRMGGMLAPAVLAGVLLVLLLGANQMDPLSLKPFLGFGWTPVFRSALFPAFVFAETMACSMFLPYVGDPRAGVRAAVLGGVLGGLATALAAAVLVMFYGSAQTTRLAYPLYDLARSVAFGEFFERMDPLFIVLWTVASFIKVSVLLWAVSHGLARLFGLKRAWSLVPPLALLFVFGAIRAYSNQAEIVTLASIQVFTLIAFPFLVGIPLLAAAGLLARRGAGGAP